MLLLPMPLLLMPLMLQQRGKSEELDDAVGLSWIGRLWPQFSTYYVGVLSNIYLLYEAFDDLNDSYDINISGGRLQQNKIPLLFTF